MANEILLGDCLEVLKTLPDASVDAIVTDPPYGLGNREPTGPEIIAYLQGADLDHGGDFMGHSWQIPSVAVWRECFRVLKPGGHLLSFAGTRTIGLIHVGIQAAGFQCRDTVATQFGTTVFSWLYGSGFPKSLNVSKALAKQGASPEVIEKWQGWGTALKPSWEPILVFRKPLAEDTVAAQVLATGTGGLNIDATRISLVGMEDHTTAGPAAIGTSSGVYDDAYREGLSPVQVARQEAGLNPRYEPKGRWPANVLLIHQEGCKQVGTQKVKAPVINRFDDGMKPFGDGAGHAFTSTQTGDADGMEEVPVYECVDGCPAKLLDQQSGVLHSTIKPSVKKKQAGSRSSSMEIPDSRPPGTVMTAYGGVGGASRFFGQIQPDAPFLYTSKVSKSERNKGLGAEGFRGGYVVLKDDVTPEDLELLAEQWPESLPSPTGPLDKTLVPESFTQFFEDLKPGINPHPCLHPDSLVLTETGYLPISSIQQGARVYSADGAFHQVSYVSCHPYTSQNLYQIEVQCAHASVLATDNHPFLVWRPDRNSRRRLVGGSVQWLKADQLKRGDYTMTPVLKPGTGGTDLPSDPDFWFLFGLYLAEGVLQQAGHGDNVYPSFSLHAKEDHLVERIRGYCTNSLVSVYQHGTNGIQVMAFDPKIGALFQTLGGHGAATKCLSPRVWDLPESAYRAIFEGWVAGDGGRVRLEYQAKTVSLALASQMQLIGEAIGYRSRINRSTAPEGAGIGERVFKSTLPCYQLNFSSIALHGERPGVRAKKPSPNRIEWEGCNYSLRLIKRVTPVPYVGDVLNLSVEGSPTFQTVVGMSHNTVKPLSLMTWLVKLVAPKGSVILDPYFGSGTTGLAALEADCTFIGIERDPVFHGVAESRLAGMADTLESRADDRRAREVFALMQELEQE